MNLVLPAAVAVGILAWLVSQTDEPTASPDLVADQGEPEGVLEQGVSFVENVFQPVSGAIESANVQAFLMLIRSGESSTGPEAYSTLYGGGRFSGFADHPRRYFDGPFGRTSAAGAYQITATTWDALRRQTDLPDFSPASQDLAAVALIKGRGALADVVAGRFDLAIGKCRREWTSLPGAAESRYGLAEARRRLVAYGAMIDTGGSVLA